MALDLRRRDEVGAQLAVKVEAEQLVGPVGVFGARVDEDELRQRPRRVVLLVSGGRRRTVGATARRGDFEKRRGQQVVNVNLVRVSGIQHQSIVQSSVSTVINRSVTRFQVLFQLNASVSMGIMGSTRPSMEVHERSQHSKCRAFGHVFFERLNRRNIYREWFQRISFD